jgi:hypothetical protein
VRQVRRATREQQLAKQGTAGPHAPLAHRQGERRLIQAAHVLAEAGTDEVVEPAVERGIAEASQRRQQLLEQPGYVGGSERERAAPERRIDLTKSPQKYVSPAGRLISIQSGRVTAKAADDADDADADATPTLLDWQRSLLWRPGS